MPSHLLHLLQPLNIGYFAPLKQAYYTKINSQLQYAVTQVKKETFLLAFYITFNKAFIKENILGSFRGARLVLYNLERVLLKLNIVLRTLTPLLLEDTLQESKTLATQKEIEAQLTLVCKCIRQYRESPILLLLQAVNSLTKGIAIIGYNLVLQTREIAGLYKAIDTLIEQRSYKRKYICIEESLTVGDVQDLIAKKEGNSSKDAKQPAKRARAQRRYRRCSKTSYNARTCTAEIVDLNNSNASKQYFYLL